MREPTTDPRESGSGAKHIALLVEVPAIYTADIDGYREFQGDQTESEFLEDVIRVSGPVRLRVEVMGEKDSDVVEVWGSVREVQLVEPSRGYEVGGALTDEQLAAHGNRLMRDERACEWCRHRDAGPEALDA